MYHSVIEKAALQDKQVDTSVLSVRTKVTRQTRVSVEGCPDLFEDLVAQIEGFDMDDESVFSEDDWLEQLTSSLGSSR